MLKSHVDNNFREIIVKNAKCECVALEAKKGYFEELQI